MAVGLERTGRIVTAAAALLAVTFLAFATSDVTLHQAVRRRPGAGGAHGRHHRPRRLLVPAFMRLAGDANWWAPAPLRRIYERFGLREAGVPYAIPATDEPQPVA